MQSLQGRVEKAWDRLQEAKKHEAWSQAGRIRVILLQGQYRLLNRLLLEQYQQQTAKQA